MFVFASRMYTTLYDEYEDFIIKWSSKGLLLPIHMGLVLAAVLISDQNSPLLRSLDHFKADPLVSPSWWLWIGPISFFLTLGSSGGEQPIVYITALIVTGAIATSSYYLSEECLTMGVLVPSIESAEEPPSPNSPGRRGSLRRELPKIFFG